VHRGHRWLTAWAALAAVASCRSISTRTLRDTEGRTVTARCDRDGRCNFEQNSGPKSPRGDGFALHSPGRLVALCDVVGGAPPDVRDCRALECTSDDACPPGHGLRDGKCLNGLCIEPMNAQGPDDAVLLCLAGKGLGRDQPRQVEAYAMGLNCGTPCVVPKPCRQP
jgi:hypothetical protein